jgi:hypothetical protein
MVKIMPNRKRHLYLMKYLLRCRRDFIDNFLNLRHNVGFANVINQHESSEPKIECHKSNYRFQ